MDGLGEQSRLPLLNIEEGDVGILLGTPLLALLVTILTGVDVLVLPSLVCGLALGAMVVYAAPRHLSAVEWLNAVTRWALLRPRVTLGTPADTDRPSTTGGPVEYLPITLDERTQDLTQIKRAWPGVGGVERADGALQGYLELHPDTMDFAQSGDWAGIQETAETFANTEVEFSLRLYVTTRAFPVEPMVDRLEQRLAGQGLETTPELRTLIEEYRDSRPVDLDGTRELHYYLGTSVERLDVYTQSEREQTPGEKLAAIPLLGILFTPFITRRSAYSDAEIRDRMVDLLDRQLSTIESEFVNQVPGWSATRCSTLDIVGLATNFWSDESIEQVEYRREPVLANHHRGEDE
jgi:hypothetical protein